MLRVEQVRAALPQGRLGLPFYHHPSLGSTNDRASQLAAEGAPEGTLVVTDHQTRGRGRAGRRWIAPPDSGLALSLVLRPANRPGLPLAAIGTIGALGCVAALAEWELQAELKWPNDVLLNGAKVGGVLVEASWSGSRLEHAILGIGLNVSEVALPRFDFPATSVARELGRPASRERLLVQVLAGTDRWYGRLIQGTVHPEWESWLAYRGKSVLLSNGKADRVGVVLGLTPQAGLRVAAEDGEEIALEAGPYQLRPI